MAVSPNNSLDILIRTKAELQGAVDTAKALEQQIGKAKALGKEYGNLEAQLNGVRASIAAAKGRQGELTDSFAEGAKKSEFLGQKHSALHKLVHQLAEAFPEAGAAARLFMNPVIFALSAAITVFAKAKEHLAELNAEMDKASEAAAKPVVSLDQMREALNATVDDIYKMRTEYAHWAKVLSEQSNQITEDLTAETEAFKDQVTAAQELLEARKNLALQRIETDQNLTPEQKAIQKFQVESTADTTKRQMTVDAGRADIKRTLEAFEAVNQKKLTLADQIAKAEKAVEAARSADPESKFQAEKDAAIAERVRAKDELDKFAEKGRQAQIDVERTIRTVGGPGPDPSQWIGRTFQADVDKFAAIRTRYDNADRAVQKIDDEAARRKNLALAPATQALHDLQAKATELKGEFDQLSISLDRQQRHQETLEKSTAAVAALDTQKKISEFLNSGQTAGVGTALTGAETIAEKSRSGRIITDQERQSLIQMAQQIAGTTMTFDQSRDYFSGLTHRPGETETARAAVDQRFLIAIERLEAVLQGIAASDKARAANVAAHPGTPIKPDEYARFRAGFKTALDEVGDVVRQVWLDQTTDIRALAKKMEQIVTKKPSGTD